jgi:hypothetical protein
MYVVYLTLEGNAVVSVCIGPSRLHGTGLFAARALPVGTRILLDTGELISPAASQWRLAQGTVDIFCLNARYDIDGTPFTNTARSITHSCAPSSHGATAFMDGG